MRWAMLAVTLGLSVGCEKKGSPTPAPGGGEPQPKQSTPKAKDFTPDDFKAITPGMSERAVVEKLGPPSEAMESGKTRRLFWRVRDQHYTISFQDDQAVEPYGPAGGEDIELIKGFMRAK